MLIVDDNSELREEMRAGFAGLRQEMDERFEKMEHRISMIFTFLSAGFTILAALITLFQFLD